MKVVVAPTSFKGTLSAVEAADAIAEGVRAAIPQAEVVPHPVADGGDGTLGVLNRSLGGELIPVPVTGPTGDPVVASILALDDDVVVIEMATASGMVLSPAEDRDVLTATSIGTGELISSALDRAPRRLIVGLGGSATVDGGLGMMRALGVGFFGRNGVAVADARDLWFLDSVDLTFRDGRLFDTDLVAACDVMNVLLGAEGAAHMFGPQKGATPEQVAELETGLSRFAEVVMRTTGSWVAETPRGGAAGGAAAALYALAGAELAPGFEVFADLTGFEKELEGADVLIVGEGSMDQLTLTGKAAMAAAGRGVVRGAEVWALAGRIDLKPGQLRGMGITRWLESGLLPDPRQALVTAAMNLAAQP